MRSHELLGLLGNDIVGIEVLHARETPATLLFILPLPPEGDGMGEEAVDVAQEDLVSRDRLATLGAVPAVLIPPGVLEVLLKHSQLLKHFVVLTVVDLLERRDEITDPAVVPPRHRVEEAEDIGERALRLGTDLEDLAELLEFQLQHDELALRLGEDCLHPLVEILHDYFLLLTGLGLTSL